MEGSQGVACARHPRLASQLLWPARGELVLHNPSQPFLAAPGEVLWLWLARSWAITRTPLAGHEQSFTGLRASSIYPGQLEQHPNCCTPAAIAIDD